MKNGIILLIILNVFVSCSLSTENDLLSQDLRKYFLTEHEYILPDSNIRIIFYSKKRCELCNNLVNEKWNIILSKEKGELCILVTDSILSDTLFDKVFYDKNSAFLKYPIKMDYIYEYKVLNGKVYSNRSLIR